MARNATPRSPQTTRDFLPSRMTDGDITLNLYMLKNYFKIALRNLWRKRAFSFINVTGLAVGMACCFLIFLYVHFELSYDRFHQKADQIYRLNCDEKTPTGVIHQVFTSSPMSIAAKQVFPEIQAVV